MRANGNGTGNGHYCPLDLVENFLRRFIIYPSEHALVAHVLWIAHAHLMDCWDTSPRIVFSSAEKESGKTLALEMTRLFVPSPDLFFDPSPAVIVRLVSQGHDTDNDDAVPTLLLDEIDNVFKKGVADPNNATLLGVLNQGYMPGATVPRCVGQNAQFHGQADAVLLRDRVRWSGQAARHAWLADNPNSHEAPRQGREEREVQAQAPHSRGRTHL